MTPFSGATLAFEGSQQANKQTVQWAADLDQHGGITIFFNGKYETKFTPNQNTTYHSSLLKSARFLMEYAAGELAETVNAPSPKDIEYNVALVKFVAKTCENITDLINM